MSFDPSPNGLPHDPDHDASNGNGNGSNGQGLRPVDEEHFKAAHQSAKRLYLILLVLGLTIGALLSVGVVAIMQRFGLTDVPTQIEQD